MQNSQTGENSDYNMQMDGSTNPDGLQAFVGGQDITVPLIYSPMSPGKYAQTLEIYRGPGKFDYGPITIYFSSNCDGYNLYSSLNFIVSYVRPCASASFYKKFTAFHVTAEK